MRTALKKRLKLIEEESLKTFGQDYSPRWLRYRSRYFSGRSPLEYANSVQKAEEVIRHIRFFQGGRV